MQRKFDEEFDQPVEHNLRTFLHSAFLVLGIPAAIYSLIQWNPSVGVNEEGEPIKFGIYFVFVLYWSAIFFIDKYKAANKRRAWQFGLLLSDTIDKQDQEKMRKGFLVKSLEMYKLQKECPELFKEGILPKP